MRPTIALALLLLPTPLAARDSLGVFDNWGAFRDPAVPRCYAIAQSEKPANGAQGYADVATWPAMAFAGKSTSGFRGRCRHPRACRSCWTGRATS